MLDIIYEDEILIAINKPHGLLVHRSRMAIDVQEFAIQLLRDQIGQRVYLAHRLDRKTSGVLLFTKSQESNPKIQQLFRERQVIKSYKAIVRGWVEPQGKIDYALTDAQSTKEAITAYNRLERFEINLASTQFPTSRYSLVHLTPTTGRFHQLRKHMAHIFHPIIGDRPHGCNKQNKVWKHQLGMSRMMLHADRLTFNHPADTQIEIRAPYSSAFKEALAYLTHNNLLTAEQRK